MHGQWDWMRDPKIHSTTWEWDNASPSEQWKHSHNELHHTYTNVIGKDNDLGYGIMRVDEDQRWVPFYLGAAAVELPQRLLLRVRHRGLRPRARQEPATKKRRADPEFKARAKQVLKKIRQQMTKDYVVHPLLSGPSFLHHAGRQRDRQPGPQPVDPLGDHVRPLPRGRRDLRAPLDRGRDPRRVVPAADARLGQHHRQQGHALHDRQPVATRSSTTCSRTCRATATPRSPRRCRRCSSGTACPT